MENKIVVDLIDNTYKIDVDLTDYNDKELKDAIKLLDDNKANISDIPTKTSDLQNDSGFITDYTETDPTVPTHVKNITERNIQDWNNKSEFSGDYNDLTNKPSIPTKTSDITNDSGFITKQVNDLINYTLKTATGSLIDLEINSSTYVVTLSLKDQDGNVISTDTIDLPLESVVVGGSYDAANQKIVLTLENGNTVDIPVGDLIAGLQTEITSQNKLASDLVDDSNNGNKFVTTSEKTTWNAKYDKPVGGIPSTDLADSVLADYVKNTDYATSQKSGVIKAGNYLMVAANGVSYADTMDYNAYNIVSNNTFIGKGTLENVITGKNLETANNKVTSISSSSTDTEYPSAKVVYDELEEKVDKVIGKGLSTEDYTTTDKSKVDNLQNTLLKNVVPFPIFDDMDVLATYEYDVNDKVYHPLYTIQNANWTRMNMNLLLAYRITTTVTKSNVNYSQEINVVELWNDPCTSPMSTRICKTDAAGSSSSGLNILRSIYPVAANLNNTNYSIGIDFNCYDANLRHIKIEVFKTDPLVTWKQSKEATFYTNSTDYGASSLGVVNLRGWAFQRVSNFAATSASSASYTTGYEVYTIGNNSIKTGASAINANKVVFLAEDGTIHEMSDTTANISTVMKKVGFLTSTTAANTAISAANFRTFYQLASTLLDNIPHATMTLGDRLFLRCTMDANGKIHSDNYVDTEMSAGYTWMPFGIATSTNTINMDTRNQQFYTLNANGELTHLDGIKIAGV